MLRTLENALLALLRRLLGRWKGPPPPFRRILAVVVAGIGDCLLATPAIRALRHANPEARIVVLVNRRVVDLFSGWPAVDAIVPLDIDLLLYDNRWGWCRPAGLRHLWQTWRALRRERFDLAVNFMHITSLRGAVLMGLLLKAVGATYRAGRDTDGRGAAFHCRVPEHWPGRRHCVVKNLAVIEALGGDADPGPLSVPISEEDQRAAEDFLAKHATLGRPLIVLHPWVSMPTDRHWPLEAWTTVVKALAAEVGAQFIVLGGPADRQPSIQWARSFKEPPIVAAGHLSLSHTAALIEKCDLFLGVLSGPLHMAAAVGTPIAACYPNVLAEAYVPYTDPARYRILAPTTAGAPAADIPPEALIGAAKVLLYHWVVQERSLLERLLR
ncbi:glycosyltransferase family 9 protein [Nitrospinae bacterium AH_259_B05_G02_I21]|nr:glycosyltransferase family 9 protein [Nitrospinae bacterium AH_259_B05_G02_I21]